MFSWWTASLLFSYFLAYLYVFKFSLRFPVLHIVLIGIYFPWLHLGAPYIHKVFFSWHINFTLHVAGLDLCFLWYHMCAGETLLSLSLSSDYVSCCWRRQSGEQCLIIIFSQTTIIVGTHLPFFFLFWFACLVGSACSVLYLFLSCFLQAQQIHFALLFSCRPDFQLCILNYFSCSGGCRTLILSCSKNTSA